MSVAPQLAVGTTLVPIDDTSFSVFQNLNAPDATTLVCGNIFIGLQGYVAVRVPLGAFSGLARGGKIETGLVSAALSFVAAGSWTAGGTLLCNVMIDDSPRAGPIDRNLAWKPPGGLSGTWRRDLWGVFDQRLEDTGGAPFIDTGLGNSGTFGIRTVVGAREQLAATFTVPAGPSWSVARAILELRRHGAPIGSMEVAIQGSTSDGYGHVEPDGVDLAVSSSVLNSTIPLTPATGSITYAFAPNVVLAPGNYWTIIRPAVAYPISPVDFVVWMQRRIFFTPNGGSHFTPNGDRFSIASYPGQADVNVDTLAKQAGPDIVWNPIARSPGQTVSTPDLSPLVREVIMSSGHETVDALCFTIRSVGETRTYRFAAQGHPTLNPPGFAAQFTRRNTRGEVT